MQTVDLNHAQHFVFQLESVVGIEEVVLCKEGVGYVLWMGMKGAGLGASCSLYLEVACPRSP